MRCSTLSVCGSLLLALAATTAAPAAARDSSSGLTFRDTRPIVVSLDDIAKGEPARRLQVCNAGRRVAERLRLTRTGFGFTPRGVAIPDGAILQHPRLVRRIGGRDVAAHQLRGGECAEIAVDVRFNAALDTGSYTGEVVVSSVGGGLARRSVTITGAPDLTVPAEPVADRIEIKVVHKSGPFHFLAPNHGHDTTILLIAAEPPKRLDVPITCTAGAAKPSHVCPRLGVVQHGTTTAQITLAGHLSDAVGGVVHLPVQLVGARNVGDYDGTIHPSGDAGDVHPVATVVRVTDAWWWALIALLFGVTVVAIPQLWMRRYKIKSKLRARANRLLSDYSRAKVEFRGDGKLANFPDIDQPESGVVFVYAADVKEAVRNLLRSTVFIETGSEAYKQIDLSLRMAERDIECWGEPRALLRALTLLQEELDRIQSWLRDRRFTRESPAITREAASLLARRRLKIGDATNLMREADATVACLRSWRAVAERTLRLQLWWRKVAVALTASEVSDEAMAEHAALGRRLARFKRRLRETHDAPALNRLKQSSALDEIEDALEVIGGPLGIPMPGDGDRHESMTGQWQRFGFAAATLDELVMGRRPDDRDDERLPYTAEDLVSHAMPRARRPASSARLEHGWRWLGDVFAIGLAIVVALIAAMAAIVNDKNFGSARDYLTVIFLGTATQAAASAIIPVLNSALSDRFGTRVEEEAAPASAAGAPAPAPAPAASAARTSDS